MTTMRIRPDVCLVVAVTLAAAGCGGESTGDDREAMADLNQIGLSYWSFIDIHKRPPANADDLIATVAEEDRKVTAAIAQRIKDGKYVVFWNVDLRPLGAAGKDVVLAYHKDVPTKGGMVVTATPDAANTRRMTAEEFKAAKMAGR